MADHLQETARCRTFAIILMDQIDRNIEHRMIPHNAVVEAAVRRFRPIMLTALAAILAMIPLSESVFFGPMAVAIMGGLLVATLLTLLFLPAVYTLWFKLTHGRKAFEEEPEPVTDLDVTLLPIPVKASAMK